MKILKVCHFTAKDENLGPPELRGQKMSAKSSLYLEPKNKEERKDGHWHEADGRCQAVKLEQLHKSTMCGTSQLLDVFQCLMLPFSIVISSKTIKNQKAQIMWDVDVFLLYVLLLDKLGGYLYGACGEILSLHTWSKMTSAISFPMARLATLVPWSCSCGQVNPKQWRGPLP